MYFSLYSMRLISSALGASAIGAAMAIVVAVSATQVDLHTATNEHN
jgi:hypothetical protein